MNLEDQVQINQKKAQSRIVLPPLVCFNWGDKAGYETVDRAKHYGLRAKGTGLVVVEATAISTEGRFHDTMLGIWEDGHIHQFEKIAKACKEENALSLVQIVHGGFQSLGPEVYSASTYDKANKTVKPMSLEHIDQVKKDFVDASIRAHKAGLDGVEVHGAHTYLLNQFTSKKTNQRQDIYGGSLENRCRLPLEIVKEIRQATSPDFIIGYRFGCNDESFEEDIVLLKALDEAGVDFFNVSAGFISSVIDMPKDFPYSYITYMGVHLKNYTEKPVACVYDIRTEMTARDLVQNFNVPMIAAGRALLADPYWSKKVLAGEPINRCHHCKPRCHYGSDGSNCPYFKEEWFKD